MSSTSNMWSDDSDAGYPSPSLRGGHGEDSSAPSDGLWMHPNTASMGGSSRPIDMDMDEGLFDDPRNPTTQAYFFHDDMSDDDENDPDESLAQMDAQILGAVTNVLSLGMDLVDDFEPPGMTIPSQSAAAGTGHNTFPPLLDAGNTPFQTMNFHHHSAANSTHQTSTAAAHNDGDVANDDHGQILHHPQHPLQGPLSLNPNAQALSPENYNLPEFIRMWAYQHIPWQGLPARDRARSPWPANINPQMSQNISSVDYTDLEGDRHDVQGIDWEDLGVTRNDARERRLLTYKNYVNIPDSDRWQTDHDMLPCTDNFFRFRRLNIRKNINLAHFQLRNVLASTSRRQVFYPGQSVVHEFNPITAKGKLGLRSKETPNFQVSTMAADYGVLVAGGFFGEYCFRNLASEDGGQVHEGTITNDNSGITNHVQLHLSRTSSSPRAAFASNDNGFRVLDLETEKFISQTSFPKPINCTATSPDGRLRVMVGDQTEVLITRAEADGKPEILKMLGGHGDYGFACDWADDGWTVATGFQDKSVKIWDARRWTDSRGRALPVCTLGSEMAGVRSLRFSPLGSGKRVLVAAEEADFVNIYDAQTFQSKQTFDFFGEIGGTSFVNDGQDLHVLCCDRVRGGLFLLERCGAGAERNHDPEDLGYRWYDQKWKNGSYDWKEFETTPRRLPRLSEARRRRRALDVGALDPF